MREDARSFVSLVDTALSTLVLDVSLRVMPVFGRNEIAKHKRQSTTGHGTIPHTFSLLTFYYVVHVFCYYRCYRCFSTTGERLS